ncbi:MAG TPA: MarR family transcriptional regulator [Woeseiaceae bacterium]|nr:MarR family transcriptional regulator [Woeseiaceae bacterium]
MADQNLYQTVLQSLPDNSHQQIAWLELVQCFSSIERVLMRQFAQVYNSSLPRYDVLTALALNRKGLTMGDLAELLDVTKGNITGVVRRLKHDQLVLKNTSKQDRRVQSVKISASGMRLWKKMHAEYDRLISELMAGQSEEQTQELVSGLKRTRRLVEKNAVLFKS